MEQVYWGDSHLNLHSRQREQFESFFQAARGHLDFLPIAYYPMDYYRTMTGLRVESWHNRPHFLREWEQVNALCAKHDEPGRFVTFPGYEWHGDRTRWGDHNVFYFSEGQPLDDCDDYGTLVEHLRQRNGLAIPHHIGYMTAQRAKDWDHFDPAITPFAELYSNHGCSETAVNRFPQANGRMGPWTSGSTYQDALRRGLHVGAICSGDTHMGFGGVYGHGLMAVWAPELTRAALWSALRARRVYGVTGDRLIIDYRLNDAPMGSIIEGDGAVTARAHLTCPQALDRVEWLRNGRVIQSYCHLDGLEGDEADPVCCRLRIEPGWGPAPNYGFEDRFTEWEGQITLNEGRLRIVQGCWTDFGNRFWQEDERLLGFHTRTAPRQPYPTQAFIIEVQGPRAARLRIDVPPFDVQFTLGEALARTQLWADLEGIQREVGQRFAMTPQEIENPDVYYHNAYKLRVVQAVPQAAFETAIELVDPDSPAGESSYYLRVSETNGQAAWTSPVWVAQ